MGSNVDAAGSQAHGVRGVSRSEVEDFLFAEAQLLSAWRFVEWLELFEEGARYEVPTFDAGSASSSEAQYFIADDWDLLKARITRMLSKHAHAENPRSHTQRLVSNVQVAATDASTYAVHANFIVYRMRDGLLDPFVGAYEHELVLRDGSLRFRLRRAVLLTESVRPGTRLSFIL